MPPKIKKRRAFKRRTLTNGFLQHNMGQVCSYIAERLEKAKNHEGLHCNSNRSLDISSHTSLKNQQPPRLTLQKPQRLESEQQSSHKGLKGNSHIGLNRSSHKGLKRNRQLAWYGTFLPTLFHQFTRLLGLTT